ncbi:MAG: hypothetical protein WCP65_01920 [Bacteroidota bacterium]
MKTNDRFFGNLFDNIHITPSRLTSFSNYTLARLKKTNPNNVFDDIIALLTPLDNQFSTEATTLDTSQNIQKGQTNLVDEFTTNFKHSISELEGVIAYAIGGKKQVGFIEFFPNGLTEYNNANRKEMSLLINRLDILADKYSKELGSNITAELKGFKTDWDTVYEEQGTAKADVSKNRSEKSFTRTALEIALMKAIHTVGLEFTDNIDVCSSIFNFNLLYYVTKHKHHHYTGSLQVGESSTIINKRLNSIVKIRVNNTGTNADIKIWLAANETEEVPVNALIVKAGKTTIKDAAELGDINNTFLRVINISAVNDAEYEVEVIG